MRLRTTATALLGALALVLPTAGLSYANDHDDRESLGTLHYRYSDEVDTRYGWIEPAGNDTCYPLTHASRNHPAFHVRNETESQALLFEGRSCGGQAVETLQPGERADDLSVRSVSFQPTDAWDHDGRHDDDWSDDEDRSIGGRAAAAPADGTSKILDSVFSSVG
ncbi:hypothetical protein [Streptomyces sp. NBC_01264]|uniref:hypothetical protein n=1 Tax=Streptomyces sp. NBC_01264 TaxID=2903804 RepID=UPI00225ADA6A|nr:hypothetical protein [Streptomyces sp. NBC_01264]MCX4781146.1 hypothetical protein [Streptomyces sp. NBC_01264]